MYDTQIASMDTRIATQEHPSSDGVSFEESDGLCRALLYALSHDLRTPLTAIRTIAAALRSADVDGDLRDALLADLDDETERLARLLANLLEAARIEAGALRPTHVRLPVAELCRGAIDDARPALDGRVVEIALEPQLPAVEVDETMIRRTLVNILENAARHDPGPLGLGAALVGGFLEIRIVDHGPGVPPADQLRIFEAFRRLRESPGGRRSGAGLGLTIARGFVEAHRGDVRVETTRGGGATFVVSLPIS
jgi:two-component system, OmpR family, sensor histidine kinase KdpD